MIGWGYWKLYERTQTDEALQRKTREYVERSLAGDLDWIEATMQRQLSSTLESQPSHGERYSPGSWSDFPILTRTALQADTAGRAVPPGATLVRSGGSTGQPVGLYLTREGFQSKRSRSLAARKLIGWRPGMPTFGIWGSDADIGKPGAKLAHFKSAASRIQLDGGFTSSHERWERMADRISRTNRPVAIFGYSSLLGAFARWLDSSGRRLTNVAVVWNGAEAIDTATREVVYRTLGTEVHDLYGARETGAMAIEVRREQGLIPLGPDVLLEVINAQGSLVNEGEVGRVLVSVLTSSGTPLLRYELGDLAEAGKRFAFGHLSLRSLQGRTAEQIPLSKGRFVSNNLINHAAKEFPFVAEFQLQVSPSDMTANMLVVSADPSQDLTPLLDLLSVRLEGYTLRGRVVDVLPRTANGKLRQVVIQ